MSDTLIDDIHLTFEPTESITGYFIPKAVYDDLIAWAKRHSRLRRALDLIANAAPTDITDGDWESYARWLVTQAKEAVKGDAA